MSRQFFRQQQSSYIFLYTSLKHFLRLAIQDNMVQVCGSHIKSRVSKKFHFFFYKKDKAYFGTSLSNFMF
jgi:hypothetical protein